MHAFKILATLILSISDITDMVILADIEINISAPLIFMQWTIASGEGLEHLIPCLKDVLLIFPFSMSSSSTPDYMTCN